MTNIDSKFEQFMNNAFRATEVVGYGKVKETHVGYGAIPDIRLYIEDSEGNLEILSAKKLYEKNVEFRL